MIYVEAPSNFPSRSFIPGIFIAGSISNSPDWQSDLIEQIKILDIIVFNPRRKNFPINDPSIAYEQIKWEHDMLRKASCISFWFSKETLSPITLFELGSWLVTPKPIVIGIDPDYPRRIDVEIQTKLVRPEIPIVYSLNDLKDAIFKMYNETLLYL